MTPEQRKSRLDDISVRLAAIKKELIDFDSELEMPVDRRAIKRIITDLLWAMENCTVVGLHQIGQALEDKMGYGPLDASSDRPPS